VSAEPSRELVWLLSLRRIHRGGVVRSTDTLLTDNGRRVPDYVHHGVAELVDTGLAVVYRDNPGVRRVYLTPLGFDVMCVLEQRRHGETDRWRLLCDGDALLSALYKL